MYFSVTIPYCLLSLLKLSNPLCKLVFPPTKCPAISVCKTELHKKVYIVLVQNRLNFGLVLIDWEGLKATWNIICILVILHSLCSFFKLMMGLSPLTKGRNWIILELPILNGILSSCLISVM